ncbi:MAG: hypothetical protein IJF33_03955, partial [Clostridia bacterium]|nr:hypothetical protein [Clostridia bacterium]
MHLFYNRPLSLACCILAGCALLVSLVSMIVALVLLAVAVLLLAISLTLFLRHRSRAPLLALICT